MDNLPTDYDTIVVGTGMPASILAAAHARNGRKVLHLDRNDYYGGQWASFNFTSLESWIAEASKPRNQTENVADFQSYLSDGESAIPCHNRSTTFKNFCVTVNIPEMIDMQSKTEKNDVGGESQSGDPVATSVTREETGVTVATATVTAVAKESPSEQPWSLSKIRSLHRKFNLDLSPKLLFSRGDLVELLISSNIARYAEFKSVTRVLTFLYDKLELVPCSRADVFSTKNVSVVEKRMLMKLLTFCMNYEQNANEYEGFEDKPFVQFLESRKLTDNLKHYVVHAIAMVQDNTLTLEGLEGVRRFLNSLGRFGNTPFLWPLYGSGELPQCFCRLCAVYGGIYYLKRDIEAIIVNSDKLCVGIVSGGKRMNCKWLVTEASYVPNTFLSSHLTRRISRAIVITDKPLLPADKEPITFLRLPKAGEMASTVSVIELGPGAMICPPGLSVVYLSMPSINHAEEDLKPAMDVLFTTQGSRSERPNVLWSLFFNQDDTRDDNCESSTSRPTNIFVTSAPSAAIDFDDAVDEARTAFKSAFPDEEFLPRAPDPEEIVIEGFDDVHQRIDIQDGTTEATSTLSEEIREPELESDSAGLETSTENTDG